MRSEHPQARVVLAFPDAATYRNLADRTARARDAANIEVWVLGESGEISEC
jgi:hypothetical protein